MNTTWTRTAAALALALAGSSLCGNAAARAGSDETFGPISYTAGYGAAVAGYSVPLAAAPVVNEVPVVTGPTTTFYAPTPTVTYSPVVSAPVVAAPVVSEPVATVAYSAPVVVNPAPVVVARPVPVTTYYAAPVTTFYAPTPVTTFYAPAPVTTYYAPSVPVTTFYAPATTTYYAPAVLPPRFYYPGQPIRNTFRRLTW